MVSKHAIDKIIQHGGPIGGLFGISFSSTRAFAMRNQKNRDAATVLGEISISGAAGYAAGCSIGGIFVYPPIYTGTVIATAACTSIYYRQKMKNMQKKNKMESVYWSKKD